MLVIRARWGGIAMGHGKGTEWCVGVAIKQHKMRPQWICDFQYYGIFSDSQIYYFIKVRLRTHGR